VNATAARCHHIGLLPFPLVGARCLALPTGASGGGPAALYYDMLIEGGPPLRAASRGVIQAGAAFASRGG
jgi:hypothetical protein